MISQEEAKAMILQNHGKIFGASFVKKDGKLRNICARLGVKKGVKGVENRQERDIKFNYLTVYDFNAERKNNKEKGAFRTLNLNTLKTIQISRQLYFVRSIQC